jgi:hypothetical protein
MLYDIWCPGYLSDSLRMARCACSMNIIVLPFNTTHRSTSCFVQSANDWNNVPSVIKRKPTNPKNFKTWNFRNFMRFLAVKKICFICLNSLNSVTSKIMLFDSNKSFQRYESEWFLRWAFSRIQEFLIFSFEMNKTF